MPDLYELLKTLKISTLGKAPPAVPIQAVTDDSRQCGPGTLFVAIEGAKADGHEYLAAAARQGSAAALVGREGIEPPKGMTLVQVRRPRQALARLAQHLAGNPSAEMTVVGVTGTNGKTTVTYMMESIFRAWGRPAGVIGTVTTRWPGHEVASDQTTPGPVQLAGALRAMREAGVQAVAMEVSSHALDQCRVDGIRFASAGLTNLTQDHLDYHKNMQAYAQAKARLFTEVLGENPDGVAVLNLDEDFGRIIARNLDGAKQLGYGMLDKSAGLLAESILLRPDGMMLALAYKGRTLRVKTRLRGLFNAQNIMTAMGMALAAGVPPEAAVEGIETMKAPPGRFETIEAGQAFDVIVDYAHTPDALEQLLLNARGLARGRMIAVFGAGGDRDIGKRAPMGQAAARLAHHLIITNDNPRTEDPARIAEMIEQGARPCLGGDSRLEIVLDRAAAIERAIGLAQKGDVVVIAGKGHEDYQIIGQTKTHFDDREQARKCLAHLGG